MFLCLHVCVHSCAQECCTAFVNVRGQENLFYHVGPREWTQVGRLSDTCLSRPHCLAGSRLTKFKRWIHQLTRLKSLKVAFLSQQRNSVTWRSEISLSLLALPAPALPGLLLTRRSHSSSLGSSLLAVESHLSVLHRRLPRTVSHHLHACLKSYLGDLCPYGLSSQNCWAACIHDNWADVMSGKSPHSHCESCQHSCSATHIRWDTPKIRR